MSEDDDDDHRLRSQSSLGPTPRSDETHDHDVEHDWLASACKRLWGLCHDADGGTWTLADGRPLWAVAFLEPGGRGGQAFALLREPSQTHPWRSLLLAPGRHPLSTQPNRWCAQLCLPTPGWWRSNAHHHECDHHEDHEDHHERDHECDHSPEEEEAADDWVPLPWQWSRSCTWQQAGLGHPWPTYVSDGASLWFSRRNFQGSVHLVPANSPRSVGLLHLRRQRCGDDAWRVSLHQTEHTSPAWTQGQSWLCGPSTTGDRCVSIGLCTGSNQRWLPWLSWQQSSSSSSGSSHLWVDDMLAWLQATLEVTTFVECPPEGLVEVLWLGHQSSDQDRPQQTSHHRSSVAYGQRDRVEHEPRSEGPIEVPPLRLLHNPWETPVEVWRRSEIGSQRLGIMIVSALLLLCLVYLLVGWLRRTRRSSLLAEPPWEWWKKPTTPTDEP